MDRFRLFLPSLIPIATIGIAAWLYHFWFSKRFSQELGSVAWIRENQKILSSAYATPAAWVQGPFLEELIFRAPLVIIFQSVSRLSWPWIVLSALAFGLIHWRGNKLTLEELTDDQEVDGVLTDNLQEIIRRIEPKHRKEIAKRRVAHCLIASVLGIIAGFYSVKYQSIWLAVGIHAAWNFCNPIQLLVVILMLLSSLISIALPAFGRFAIRFCHALPTWPTRIRKEFTECGKWF